MNAQTVAASISLAVALVIFVYGGSCMARKTFLDAFRSDMFSIRDDMFNFMAENGASFDLPAYNQLRDAINALIRFAHQFHLTSLLLAIFAAREANQGGELVTVIHKTIDPEIQKYLISVYVKVFSRTLRYVMFEGPQAFVTIPLIVLGTVIMRHGQQLRGFPPSFADKLMTLGRKDSPEGQRMREAMAV